MSVIHVKETFVQIFGHMPDVMVQAPGRINIMGEHTDYNDGFVLPAAINHYIYLALSSNPEPVFDIQALDLNERVSLTVPEIVPGSDTWLNLIKGVLQSFMPELSGIKLTFCGDIPDGAGLSSSAALCCGVGLGLNELLGKELAKWDLAKIAQKSEHEFAGVQCGIMDQFASLFGQADHVFKLDCQDLSFETTRIDMSGYKFLLLNSNVKHELNESEYNARRVESSEALEALKGLDSSFETYRDVSLDYLQDHSAKIHWWKRAHHILSDNIRVTQINEALQTNDMVQVGKLLNEGHISQRDHYEITCPETDFLVEELNRHAQVMGARQVGGGFGGCVLAVVRDEDLSDMLEEVNRSYEQNCRLLATTIPIRISDGCRIITD